MSKYSRTACTSFACHVAQVLLSGAWFNFRLNENGTQPGLRQLVDSEFKRDTVIVSTYTYHSPHEYEDLVGLLTWLYTGDRPPCRAQPCLISHRQLFHQPANDSMIQTRHLLLFLGQSTKNKIESTKAMFVVHKRSNTCE